MKSKKFSFLSVLVCMMLMLLVGLPSASAEENNNKKSTIKLSYGENYENPETGEYFRWVTAPNARGTVAKNFEFKIRYSVSSAGFTISGSSVSIDSSASVQDEITGDYVDGYDGHKYTVALNRTFSSKSLQFALGETESGTISGLSSGSTYTIEITNNDYLPSSHYLVGSGTVTNN